MVVVHEEGYAAWFTSATRSPIHNFWSYLQPNYETITWDAIALLHVGEQATAEKRLQRSTAKRTRTVQRERQADPTGCGIACLAMLARVSYSEAKRAIFGNGKRRTFLTSYADIRRGFDHFGIGYESRKRARKFTSWKEISGPAPVAIENAPGNRNVWHWVVFYRRGEKMRVLDPDSPLETLARNDFRRMKGLHYLLLDPAVISDPRREGEAIEEGPLSWGQADSQTGQTRWLKELGALTVTLARERRLRDDICRATGLMPRVVTRKLNAARGNMLLRNLFSWPARPVERERESGTMRAAQACADAEVIAAIAELTNLSRQQVRRKLKKSHGNVLVKNVFADVWPREHAEPGSVVPAKRTQTSAPKQKTTPGRSAGVLINGRYRRGRLLGEGGFGAAYEAVDTVRRGEPLVVLKFGKNDSARVELEKEFEYAASLSHPNLCRYFQLEIEASTGRPFLVLEHAGRSLEQMIARRYRFGLSDALRIIGDAAIALEFLHENGVIHYDVSPANLLVDESGAVKLTDFGASRRAASRTGRDGRRTVVAATTTVAGHHRIYSAPEVVLEDAGRPKSDQYSLALVFCSMILGRIFDRRYKARRIPRLSRAQNQAIARALADNPDERFPSVAAFSNALAT